MVPEQFGFGFRSSFGKLMAPGKPAGVPQNKELAQTGTFNHRPLPTTVCAGNENARGLAPS